MKSHQKIWGAIQTLVLAVSGLGMLTGCVGQRNVSDRDIRALSLTQVINLIEEQQADPDSNTLLLLDSRSEQKFTEGHLPGAEHIKLSDINPNLKRDKRIESYDNIVVYADNPGSASARGIVKRMLMMRYDDVRLFPGGFDQWTRSGLDVRAEQ